MKGYNEATDTYGSYIKDPAFIVPVAAGYAVWAKVNPRTVVFRGEANTGNILSGVLQKTKNGYNLVGNPYPSPIDWEAMDKTGLSSTIWVWNGSQYATYTAGIGGTNGGSRYLSMGQGFFVQTLTENNVVSFTNNVRVAAPVNLKEMMAETDNVRIKISGGSLSDECIVAFRPGASNGYESGRDAEKRYGSPDYPQIYTLAENTKLTVNILSTDERKDSIPFVAEVPYNGTYTLTIRNTGKTRYALYDKKLDYTTEATDYISYAAALSAGEKDPRFYLILKETTASDSLMPDDTGSVNKESVLATGSERGDNIDVYIIQGNVLLIEGLDESADTRLEVYTLDGRLMIDRHYAKCQMAESSSLPAGTYVVRICNGQSVKTAKVFLPAVK